VPDKHSEKYEMRLASSSEIILSDTESSVAPSTPALEDALHVELRPQAMPPRPGYSTSSLAVLSLELSADGAIRFMSQALCQLLGYERWHSRQMLGANAAMNLIHPNNRSEFQETLRQLVKDAAVFDPSPPPDCAEQAHAPLTPSSQSPLARSPNQKGSVHSPVLQRSSDVAQRLALLKSSPTTTPTLRGLTRLARVNDDSPPICRLPAATALWKDGTRGQESSCPSSLLRRCSDERCNSSPQPLAFEPSGSAELPQEEGCESPLRNKHVKVLKLRMRCGPHNQNAIGTTAGRYRWLECTLRAIESDLLLADTSNATEWPKRSQSSINHASTAANGFAPCTFPQKEQAAATTSGAMLISVVARDIATEVDNQELVFRITDLLYNRKHSVGECIRAGLISTSFQLVSVGGAPYETPNKADSRASRACDLSGIQRYEATVKMLHASFSDLALVIDESSCSGAKVMTSWRLSGLHTGTYTTLNGDFPPSGRRISVSGLSIDTVRRGKLMEHVRYTNEASLLEQIILIPRGCSSGKLTAYRAEEGRASEPVIDSPQASPTCERSPLNTLRRQQLMESALYRLIEQYNLGTRASLDVLRSIIAEDAVIIDADEGGVGRGPQAVLHRIAALAVTVPDLTINIQHPLVPHGSKLAVPFRACGTRMYSPITSGCSRRLDYRGLIRLRFGASGRVSELTRVVTSESELPRLAIDLGVHTAQALQCSGCELLQSQIASQSEELKVLRAERDQLAQRLEALAMQQTTHSRSQSPVVGRPSQGSSAAPVLQPCIRSTVAAACGECCLSGTRGPKQ